MAQVVNITIDQGSDFSFSFDLSKLAPSANVANCTVHASMVKELDEPNTSISFLTSLIGSELTITLTNAVTANLTPDTWVYDAVLIKDGTLKTRVVQGRARVDQAVTQV